jgi:Domain of unknown function (DUF5667)
MRFSPKIEWWVGAATKTVMMGIGIVILFVSMARAGWETRAKDNSDEVKGNNLVEFMAVFDDGTTAAGNYKLPETGMLPDNMFYGAKEIRNYLWLLFSSGEGKIKMALLLADKSASESGALIEKDESNLAIDAGNEAINKLEYAETLIDQVKVADAQTKQIHYQIFWAGWAYKQVFVKMQDSFDLDTERYTNLITRVDDWNKTQEENRYNWDN